MTYRAPLIPKAFIWRRLHSLMGLWIVLFLIEHLFLNSQAALFIGDDGLGFIKGVNDIHSLPYLPVVEAVLLGVPFLIHGWWGVQYLLTGKTNSSSTDGSSPSLPEYPRNRAYTWQRITSWILLFGIVAHVIQMRFIEDPATARVGTEHFYMVRLDADAGLQPLSKRLGFDLYGEEQIPSAWQAALEKRPLHAGQVVAVAPNFGLAELLMVRETFKNPLMIALYTILVLAACFHGFNGLWTFMITWGVTLTERSQWWMRKLTTGFMILLTFLGLAAIWGTYWINLYQ